ncbi:DNA translocase FtsK [Pseudooceanicola nanhaiensis]|jgi:S-DNA-T family DNA segregation ATPase FtsK/SpoIIIE|uniref:DNA translocase FtsK n=1 Tax=Pseudooceanicola nanhaiensis TaxID=375761 RepID=A0A917SVM5_9RHOB|nr:DNA translocase FtsK [Pseudooceanicola nanhaiensis]GGL98705.1 DNA translocase FtsK [Pseudooceanicola nanhaiensis]
MAYQTRGRDPLFDSNVQAAIEKRGKELVGVLVLALGVLLTLSFASYSPDDPSWVSVTDQPVQNWLGRLGAGIAAPVFMILGIGGWGFAALALVWGVRLALHQGEERAMSRLVFAPIWIVVLSLYAASLVPGEGWSHSFGLGGLFGDTVLGTLIGVAPVSATAGLKILSLVLGAGVVALGIFVLGFTRGELRNMMRYAVYAVVLAYVAVTRLLGRGAQAGWSGALAAREAARDRKERRRAEALERAEAGDYVIETYPEDDYEEAPRTSFRDRLGGIVRRAAPAEEPLYEDDPWETLPEHYEEPPLRAPAVQAQPQPRLGGVTRAPAPSYPVRETPIEAPAPAPKAGFLSRLPSMIRRAGEGPAPFAEVEDRMLAGEEMPLDDRIKTKIADAVRQRARTSSRISAPSHQPLTKGRGRGPDPLILGSTPRAEPPLTGGAQPAVAPAPRAAAPSPAPAARVVAPSPAPLEPEAEEIEDYGMDAWEDEAAEAEAPAPVAPRLPQAAPAEQARRVVQTPARKAQPSTRAREEAQPKLKFEERAAEFDLPPLNLLMDPTGITRHHLSDEALEENARMLETVLDDYGVKGDIVSVRPGPVVTMYELEPAPGLKASRVIGLADDIARSMAALSARVSTVPGRSVIGIELPNDNREMVVLREILSAREFGDSNMKLPLALGKDIGGGAVVANLAKMPHLLIAGTTGSGKSVAINTMILSLLYKRTPEECRLIMIDPKMLELSVYDGIPHLLSPVVTDPKKAVVALKWTVGEMEERYRKMSKMGVRNIDGYNGRVADALSKGEMFSRTVQTGFDEDTGEPIFETEEIQPEKMPYIVVIVDEMADLMMVAGKEIEACIQRLAQMARASGIHLIMATQRPSVDVITGTIKANFPTRISFQVTSKIDSRTILGEMGAEQLLGQGDMLYMAGGAKIQRCHGPFVSDEEVEEIVNHLKAYGPPDYVGGVVEGPAEDKENDIDLVLGLGGNTDGEDALYDQAVAVVIKDRKCSTSYIQRKLGIGYNKAARLVEQMEDEGLVSPANHVGKREILVPEQQ